MDYTTQGWLFRVKKAIRYSRLYGLPRTIVKIKGQYHMKKRYVVWPKPVNKLHGHVGLLGCGNFAFSNIAYYLRKNFGPVIRGVMDIDMNRAASLSQAYGGYYTDDANRVIEDPNIDLIFIATNHASHAEYAIKALEAGKSVHIEKPHVVSQAQLDRLCRAMTGARGRVALGFNRPVSKLGCLIKQHLDSQAGPAMFNWFVAGHAIEPDHWYFSEEEGGRVLGNLCHWTDFTLQMLSESARYPVLITPTRGKKSDCDIAVTYHFGDGSIAAITFSAKGHAFEGVRERFAAHRGEVLISLDDFKILTVEVRERKYRPFLLFRDHGHEACIKNSYHMVMPRSGEAAPGVSCGVEYVRQTAELFLATKQALEQDCRIALQADGCVEVL